MSLVSNTLVFTTNYAPVANKSCGAWLGWLLLLLLTIWTSHSSHNTCVMGILNSYPQRQSLQCRKHSFPHPSVHQTDRYYCCYYYYCSSRGWNTFKHWVFKNISLYNHSYNFSQKQKLFTMSSTTKNRCILLCFLKMGSNWTPLYAKTQVFTMCFFNLRVNVSKNMFLIMF